MPKMKTKSGAAKRFRVRGSGSVKRYQAGKRHILTKRTTKNKRQLRGSTSVDKTIRLVDDAAAEANDVERAEMAQAFDYASRMEWAFWDAAWRLETWPPYEVHP